MKVLLVNAVSYYVKQKATIPLGLLSLATHLTQAGHTVELFDRAVDGGGMSKRLRGFKPDIVGVSSLGIMSFDDAIKVSITAKKAGLPVVWGGHIPTLIPDIVLKTGTADYVILGDGEYPFAALLNALSENTPVDVIEGLAYIQGEETVVNHPRTDTDLAQLPVIDFSFVDPEKYFIRNMDRERMLHVYSSKGCIGKCTYCYCPAHSGGRWRARPTENFIRELRYLKEVHRIDGFYFVDDLFAPNRERVAQVCDALLDSGLDLIWSCDMRTDGCTEEILQRMYEAGCRWIFFGIESGSDKRQMTIRKKLDTAEIETVLSLCARIGIWTTTSFVIGFPDETVEELKQTLELVRRVKSDVKLAALYGPMPESEMYKELLENQRLTPPKSYKEWKTLAVIDELGNNYSQIPAKHLKVISSYFFYAVFRTKKTDSAQKVASHVWFRRLFGNAFDIVRRGNLKALYILVLSAKEFSLILYYALCFPKIRNKYGLGSSNSNKSTPTV